RDASSSGPRRVRWVSRRGSVTLPPRVGGKVPTANGDYSPSEQILQSVGDIHIGRVRDRDRLRKPFGCLQDLAQHLGSRVRIEYRDVADRRDAVDEMSARQTLLVRPGAV